MFLWLFPIAWMALIFAASNTPSSDIPDLWFWKLPEADKIAHAGIYFILSLALYIPLSKHTVPGRPGLAAALTVVAALVYGMTDELHQSLIPGRSPSLADLAADCFGAVVAAALAHTLAMRSRSGIKPRRRAPRTGTTPRT